MRSCGLRVAALLGVLCASVAPHARAAEPPATPQSDGTRGQTRSSAAPDDEGAYRADRYRAHLRELCGERMAGRAAGSEGGENAIVWLERELVALGLEPAIGERLRQDFLAPDPAPPSCAAGTGCEVTGGVGRRQLVLREDWAPFPFSPDGSIGAEVVFVGHGLEIPELGIDDYRDVDVRGRVVLVFRGGPRWREDGAPVRAHARQLTFRRKAELAAAHGALALVLVDRDDRGHDELAVEDLMRARGDAQLPAIWMRRAAVDPWFTHGGLLAAQRALDVGEPAPALESPLRMQVRVRMVQREPRRTANVIGLLRATAGDGSADELVLVGAHHDHIGRGEFGSLGSGDEVGRIHPGADDNASGTAALLELARRFARRGPGRRGVVFAAFGAEELGQVGSRWLLDHPPSGRIVAAVDLNMIGRARSSPLQVYGVATGKGLRELVAATAPAVDGLRLQLRDRSSYRSDQGVFIAHGIPALLLTTGLHDQYHRPGDVPELVEVDGAMLVTDFAEALVRGLVDGPAPAFDRESKPR